MKPLSGQTPKPAGKTLLVLGHPSHELRIFHWLITEKPVVFILTDGSANRGFPVSRHTAAYLQERGIAQGSLFGAFPDRDFYGRMQAKDLLFFRSLARHLAEEFSAPSISRVAGDAIEGFNPTHDLCRMLINAACAVANSRRSTPVESYEFDLVGPVTRPEDADRKDLIILSLSERERAEKIAFARAYPGVEADVERQVKSYGEESFGTECLRPADAAQLGRNLFPEKPPYEQYGEERVKSGVYQSVLRYSEHVRIIQDDLRRWAEECGSTITS